MPNQSPRPRGRPRKAPDDQRVRQGLIKTGLIALTERGYCDVSVDDILKTCDATKGSFYHHFSSKAAYGRALIEAYDAYFQGKLRNWFDRMDLSPLSRLRGFADDAAGGMAKHGFRRGCLIGNLGQEGPSLPEDMSHALIAVLVSWQDLTATCLREACACGEISEIQDPDALAAFFWIGWEGAVLRAKLERSAAPLNTFTESFFDLIRQSAIKQGVST